MGSAASRGSTVRYLAGVVAVGSMWWVAFEHDDRIPLLTYVNLAVHETGHLLTSPLPHLATVLAGSIAQVAIPLLLAGYFLFLRGDWLGAGLCLAWGATSALEVAVYVADAPAQELELVGGSHDWAYILGPDGYAAMDQADDLAQMIRDGAAAAIVTGFALCLANGFRHRPQAERSPARARGAVPNA